MRARPRNRCNGHILSPATHVTPRWRKATWPCPSCGASVDACAEDEDEDDDDEAGEPAAPSASPSGGPFRGERRDAHDRAGDRGVHRMLPGATGSYPFGFDAPSGELVASPAPDARAGLALRALPRRRAARDVDPDGERRRRAARRSDRVGRWRRAVRRSGLVAAGRARDADLGAHPPAGAGRGRRRVSGLGDSGRSSCTRADACQGFVSWSVTTRPRRDPYVDSTLTSFSWQGGGLRRGRHARDHRRRPLRAVTARDHAPSCDLRVRRGQQAFGVGDGLAEGADARRKCVILALAGVDLADVVEPRETLPGRVEDPGQSTVCVAASAQTPSHGSVVTQLQSAAWASSQTSTQAWSAPPLPDVEPVEEVDPVPPVEPELLVAAAPPSPPPPVSSPHATTTRTSTAIPWRRSSFFEPSS